MLLSKVNRSVSALNHRAQKQRMGTTLPYEYKQKVFPEGELILEQVGSDYVVWFFDAQLNLDKVPQEHLVGQESFSQYLQARVAFEMRCLSVSPRQVSKQLIRH